MLVSGDLEMVATGTGTGMVLVLVLVVGTGHALSLQPSQPTLSSPEIQKSIGQKRFQNIGKNSV